MIKVLYAFLNNLNDTYTLYITCSILYTIHICCIKMCGILYIIHTCYICVIYYISYTYAIYNVSCITYNTYMLYIMCSILYIKYTRCICVIHYIHVCCTYAAAAKSLRSCPTPCDPTDAVLNVSYITYMLYIICSVLHIIYICCNNLKYFSPCLWLVKMRSHYKNFSVTGFCPLFRAILPCLYTETPSHSLW